GPRHCKLTPAVGAGLQPLSSADLLLVSVARVFWPGIVPGCAPVRDAETCGFNFMKNGRVRRVKLILPALTEATSPFWRPIKYSLFPPLGLATLAAYLDPDLEISLQDEHVEELDLFFYSAGWKKFERAWGLIIRLRQLCQLRPLLEAVLAPVDRHNSESDIRKAPPVRAHPLTVASHMVRTPH